MVYCDDVGGGVGVVLYGLSKDTSQGRRDDVAQNDWEQQQNV